MATDGVNGQQQFDIYSVNYQKDIKPKDEQTTRSLFNALWDEAADMLNEADANHDGVVDAQDVPKLQKLVGMLQDAQGTIIKNIKKFTFDAQRFQEGFQTCEGNLRKVINDITSGKYVSQKQLTEEAQAKAEAEAKARAAEQASLEPKGTDNDTMSEALKKRIFMREVARGYGCGPRENGHGGWEKLDSSNINEMYYKMLGNERLTPQEKVEVFTAWLDLWHSDITSQDMENWGKPKLRALMKSAEMHEFLDTAINEYINNDNYGSSYIERHGNEYQAVMQKYGHSHNFDDDMHVVNPDYKKES